MTSLYPRRPLPPPGTAIIVRAAARAPGTQETPAYKGPNASACVRWHRRNLFVQNFLPHPSAHPRTAFF